MRACFQTRSAGHGYETHGFPFAFAFFCQFSSSLPGGFSGSGNGRKSLVFRGSFSLLLLKGRGGKEPASDSGAFSPRAYLASFHNLRKPLKGKKN